MAPVGQLSILLLAEETMLTKTLSMDARDVRCLSNALTKVTTGHSDPRKVLQHPWQPTRLNGWNSVCSLLHSLCSTCCTNQTEEPCEPPKRCSTNITSQAIRAGQGSVYVHSHCHKEQSSTQQFRHKMPVISSMMWHDGLTALLKAPWLSCPV